MDLARCTMGIETPAHTMSTFATAFLFLNLAVMTGVYCFHLYLIALFTNV